MVQAASVPGGTWSPRRVPPIRPKEPGENIRHHRPDPGDAPTRPLAPDMRHATASIIVLLGCAMDLGVAGSARAQSRPRAFALHEQLTPFTDQIMAVLGSDYERFRETLSELVDQEGGQTACAARRDRRQFQRQRSWELQRRRRRQRHPVHPPDERRDQPRHLSVAAASPARCARAVPEQHARAGSHPATRELRLSAARPCRRLRLLPAVLRRPHEHRVPV